MLFEAGANNPYCATEDGKKLTRELFDLLSKKENIETIRQVYMTAHSRQDAYPLLSVLGAFLDEEGFGAVYADKPEVSYERSVVEENKKMDPLNLCASVLYNISNPLCKDALYVANQRAVWDRFETIGKQIEEKVKNSGECSLKADLEGCINKIDNLKGKAYGTRN